MDKKLTDSFKKLYKWIERESFYGYDPYDALNTDLDILKSNKFIRIYSTYFNKFSPVNLRKLFKIAKSKGEQGLSLIILSLCNNHNINSAEAVIDNGIDFILSRSLIEKYGYHCWNGHNFPIQTTKDYQLPTTPDVIATEHSASAIFEYYKSNPKRNDLKEALLSVKDFFLNILLVKREDGVFFKYQPTSNNSECVYNASLRAAIYILKINKFFGIREGNEVIKDCYEFVLSLQNSNGSWYYSIDLRNNNQKKQIDFHQGFVLDAIEEYLESQKDDDNYLKTYRKGLEFYLNKQFLPTGQSLYRYPRKWPVDIHNQAQGIITFSRAGPFDKKYSNFARIVADWTINNMQDEEGYFYYLKYPFITNKIPYLRWGQAWMLYALSHLKTFEI